MGLFDAIKSLFAPRPPDIGSAEPICPYCGHRLDKMPGRKKKCPACSRHMLVRTRPSDRRRILIREDQALQIEEQWAIANGTHAQFLAARREHEAERNRLRARFGCEPSENDIKWAQVNDGLLRHATEFQWGFYRNDRLGMGDILKKDRRYLSALDTYLEVCYLDLNGPNNCSTRDPAILREFPPFNPNDGMLAPGVLRYVQDMLKREGLSKNDAGARFLRIAAKVQRSLSLPVAPERAWERLSKELG
jgi:DNA-directed RNA polymerase subunit RPC12/RpoP